MSRHPTGNGGSVRHSGLGSHFFCGQAGRRIGKAQGFLQSLALGEAAGEAPLKVSPAPVVSVTFAGRGGIKTDLALIQAAAP